MFFHQQGLGYFIEETKKALALFSQQYATDGRYKIQYTTASDTDALKSYAHKTIHKLKEHIIDINNHISSEEHTLKQIHQLLVAQTLALKIKHLEKMPQEEVEVHENIVRIYEIHKQLLPQITAVESAMPSLKEVHKEPLAKSLRELLHSLEELYTLSVATGKLLKSLMKRIDENNKQLERMGDDFEKNLNSWLHLYE